MIRVSRNNVNSAGRIKFNTTIDPEIHQRARIMAFKLQKNLNDLIEEGLNLVMVKYSSKYGQDDYLRK